MIQELMGAYGGRLLVAILGVAVGLACLIGVLWLVRGRRAPSPFVRGGKNRQPRLQVLDAAAVDARRRLVLVRRDDTEHLIMIGGPTDIVIESGITAGRESVAASSSEGRPVNVRPSEPQERPPAPPRAVHPAPKPEARQEPQRPSPSLSEVPQRPQVPSPAPEAPFTPSAAPRFEGMAGSAAAVAAAASSLAAPPRHEPALDDAAEILDAARSRVLQGPTVPVRTPPPDLIIPTSDGSKSLGSDFERVLEEEMANNLAAPQTADLPPRPADKPPVTGATTDPSLQAEVARIFGEMSVTREK